MELCAKYMSTKCCYAILVTVAAAVAIQAAPSPDAVVPEELVTQLPEASPKAPQVDLMSMRTAMAQMDPNAEALLDVFSAVDDYEQ